MKLADMKKKSAADLEKHATKLRKNLGEKRRNVLTADDKNVREIRHMRKELAQTLTLANQRKEDIKDE